MPTREQIKAVTRKIRWLESMSYLRKDDQPPVPVSDLSEPWWQDLSPEEQKAVLTVDVNWEGFSESQRENVINRALEGKEPDSWMDGIEVDPDISQQALDRIEDEIEMLKVEPEIHLESTRRYVMPDLEDAGSVYDTCDVLGPWDTLKGSDRLRALRELDWTNVPPHEALRIIDREVDLSQISEPSQKQWISAIRSRDHGGRQADELPPAAELASLAAEIRADEQAARVRDYGEADAATYERRVADGAETVRHLDPPAEPVPAETLERSVVGLEQQWIKPEQRLKAILEVKTPAPETPATQPDRERER